MDKFPRLNYRPKKARPFIVRYYDCSSNKRTSRSFSARMDAMQFLAEMGGEGKDRASYYEISTAEKDMLIRLKRECFIRGMELCELETSFTQLIRTKPAYDKTLIECVGEYLKDCDSRKIRAATIRYYRQKLNLLMNMYSPRIFISSITSEMLESFINGKGSREHNKRVISAFYAYLMRKRILSENPLLRVVSPRNRRRRRIPGILTVAQTIRLFQELPESCVAAFALMTFFGIRPQEITSETKERTLRTEDIDIKTRSIKIPEETAKMGNWRNISNLPETAWSWLEAYMPKEGPIFPYSYATYRRIQKLLSVKIPKDGLRHSMASYGYHELGIETTVEILGQESGYEVFKRHYKAMVSPDDAKAFFSISPDIRDGLPKTKIKQMPYRGLVGEIEENIKFLDKAKKQ